LIIVPASSQGQWIVVVHVEDSGLPITNKGHNIQFPLLQKYRKNLGFM